RFVRAGAVALALAATVLAGNGWAALEPGTSRDEPGVARVSLIEGQVSYLRGDSNEWAGVSVNAPLVTGDRFYSGADSRAEIQLAPGTDVRLGSDTELDLIELAPDRTQARIELGRASLRLRRDPTNHPVELDTPAVALSLRQAGVYRVEVDS